MEHFEKKKILENTDNSSSKGTFNDRINIAKVYSITPDAKAKKMFYLQRAPKRISIKELLNNQTSTNANKIKELILNSESQFSILTKAFDCMQEFECQNDGNLAKKKCVQIENQFLMSSDLINQNSITSSNNTGNFRKMPQFFLSSLPRMKNFHETYLLSLSSTEKSDQLLIKQRKTNCKPIKEAIMPSIYIYDRKPLHMEIKDNFRKYQNFNTNQFNYRPLTTKKFNTANYHQRVQPDFENYACTSIFKCNREKKIINKLNHFIDFKSKAKTIRARILSKKTKQVYKNL